MKEELADIKESIQFLTATLTERINKLEQKIEADITAIEEKLTAEIVQLRNENKTLVEQLQVSQVATDKALSDLRTEYEAREDALKLRLQEQDTRIVNLERAVHGGLQHDRKFNVEIDGIPANIGDDPVQLEEAVLVLFEALNISCDSGDIDAIHRLPSNKGIKPTIVRLRSRKTVEEIHANKNKLKNLSDLNVDIAGLQDDSQIYIRPSLCPYFRKLAYNCRQLKRGNLIKNTFVGDDGVIKIKLNDDKYIKITHETDLTNLFQDFAGFTFT